MSTRRSAQTVSPADVRRWFADGHYTAEERAYLEYHAARIAFLIDLVDGHVADYAKARAASVRVLDIGPHFVTAALRVRFGTAIRLNTMGWANYRLAPPHVVDKHFEFDLNDAQDDGRWPASEPHDIVLMAEVIEHLYTSPRIVLSFVKTFLTAGGVLILQTPNAVRLRNRLKMLLGRHPFEPIRDTRDNPGHFREYTARELRSLCRDASLNCERIFYADYWPERAPWVALQWINPNLRNGLTVVARKPRDSDATRTDSTTG